MKENSFLKTNKNKIIAIFVFLAIILVATLNIFISQKISKSINTKKQEVINKQISAESLAEQQRFFEDNPDISSTLSGVLPNQDSILNLIQTMEQLQESLNITPNFQITSISPTQSLNNSYVTFMISTNTTTIKSLALLRSFEKLPYLTTITSLNLKTPQGIGGPVELSITGKIYVQDPF